MRTFLFAMLMAGLGGLWQAAYCQPAWASATYLPPNSGEIYYSIQHGYMRKDAKTKFYDKALAEISSQIETYIRSEIISQDKQKRLGDQFFISQQIEQTIKSSSSATLFGEDLDKQEYVDAKSKTYWIFLSISKATYQQRLMERIGKAKQKALSNFRNAQKARESDQFVLAINNYISALDALRDFAATQDMLVQENGESFYIDDMSTGELKQLFGIIYIEAVEKTLRFSPQDRKQVQARVFARTPAGDRPVHALPVSFSVAEGETAHLDTLATTNQQGIATCVIQSATWDANGLRIKAQPGWNLRLDPLLRGIYGITPDNQRYADFHVSLLPPRVTLRPVYSPPAGLTGSNVNLLQGRISEHLTTTVSAEFSDNPAESDFQINLKVSATTLGKFDRMYSVEVTVLLELLDLKSNKVTYSNKGKTRAPGLSYEQAFNAALERYEVEPVLSELEKFLVR